jgi:hypothetical protein
MSQPGQPTDRQQYSTFVVELLMDEHRNVRRTRVVHIQSGIEKRWAGWAQERLLAFLGPIDPRILSNDPPAPTS